jgi:aryl-alcohol dehydrogenase-like predicted oxidoreductase
MFWGRSRWHGFLTGTIRSPEDLADDDWRKNSPRFTEGNFEKSLRIVGRARCLRPRRHTGADRAGLATRARRRHRPIPGTKRASHVEENTSADAIKLSAKQIERLNGVTLALGA